MVSMVSVLTMMVAVTLVVALLMAFLMPVLVSVAMLILVPVRLVVALLMAVMMTMAMTAVMSVVVTPLLAMMMAVVVNMMIAAILSLSNLRKSLGVTTIMVMLVITSVDALSLFLAMTMTLTTVAVTVMSRPIDLTVLPTTLAIILNLLSPLLSFGWVVFEIFTRDQRCRDEPVKGLLDTVSSSTIFSTLLTHDDLEGLLGFNATSKIQNEGLSHV